MKRVVVDRYGGPEVLKVIETTIPGRVRARSASGC
jgi:hypothetical protein